MDSYETSFGIRTIEFNHDQGFMLNGQKVAIKGVCMHHDLGALGAAFNEVAAERQLRIMKRWVQMPFVLHITHRHRSWLLSVTVWD